MKILELRRHAAREKEADALTPEGRVQAEDLGRSLRVAYDVLFVSPAQRAAETAAWILRGAGKQLPDHAVVKGLISEEENRWRAAGKAAGSSRLDVIADQDPDLVAAQSKKLADAIVSLFDRVAEGGRALVIGHTPLLEAAVYGLTGTVVEPLGECEGIALTQQDDGDYRIEELRLPPRDTT
jgi:broad specificity phosphatase PhoE